MIFSGFSFACVALLRWIQPSWMPDPGRMLSENGYVSSHYHKIIWTLLIEEIVALVAVWLYDTSILVRKGSTYYEQSIWDILFQEDVEKKIGFVNRNLRNLLAWIYRIKKEPNQPAETPENVLAETPPSKNELWKVARVTLMSHEEIVGFPLNWSDDSYDPQREVLLETVAEWNIELLPEELREIAKRDVSCAIIYVASQTIEKVSIYYLSL